MWMRFAVSNREMLFVQAFVFTACEIRAEEALWFFFYIPFTICYLTPVECPGEIGEVKWKKC